VWTTVRRSERRDDVFKKRLRGAEMARGLLGSQSGGALGVGETKGQPPRGLVVLPLARRAACGRRAGAGCTEQVPRAPTPEVPRPRVPRGGVVVCLGRHWKIPSRLEWPRGSWTQQSSGGREAQAAGNVPFPCFLAPPESCRLLGACGVTGCCLDIPATEIGARLSADWNFPFSPPLLLLDAQVFETLYGKHAVSFRDPRKRNRPPCPRHWLSS
jgi:hypothetical protein